jgi:sodium/potassium-transporting ATPase subunit alpha
MKKETKKGTEEKFNSKLTYHRRSLNDLASQFETSLTNGLSIEKAAQRLAKNGKNRIEQKRKNPITKIVRYFFSGFCVLLWLAAIVCILCYKPLGEPNPQFINLALGVMLIIVILIQALFNAFQDWSSNKVMKSIKNLLPSKAVVVRGGVEQTIASEDIVIGDLVVLISGNKVPADVRLISSNDLKFDNSMLTGESDPVEGVSDCTDERYVESRNIAFMTSLIVNGRGKGIVTNTGNQTVIGQISVLTNATKPKKTSLQKELRRFVVIIVAAAVCMAIAVTITWVVWIRVQYPNYLNISSYLVNTIAVMIAFIPESKLVISDSMLVLKIFVQAYFIFKKGLPICVTLSLLVIAKRMAKSNVLVKDLSTIETLSCVNVIASDKTGTLTQNKVRIELNCNIFLHFE